MTFSWQGVLEFAVVWAVVAGLFVLVIGGLLPRYRIDWECPRCGALPYMTTRGCRGCDLRRLD
jgi:hypothetical protein